MLWTLNFVDSQFKNESGDFEWNFKDATNLNDDTCP